MKTYLVKQYEAKYYNDWNAFIVKTKNATFLFHRDFMEYHGDRFMDFSLLVFHEEKLVALLPANKVDATVYSHQGLTYGGLIYKEKTKLISVIEIFKNVLFYLNSNGIDHLYLKTIPSIYHSKPAEEIQYALFLVDALLVRRDCLVVIDLSQEINYSKIRKRGVQKGIDNNLQIKEEHSFEAFWNEILIPNLNSKHNENPVHSLDEINRLKRFFPMNIRQFNVYHNDKIVAGITVFETTTVAHCQYISMNPEFSKLGSLDFLIHFLITKKFVSKRYFDFGISNVSQGKKLNEGLSYWKESFGASTIVHDFYEVKTAHYSKLDNVII
ncbi:GNAT family N-acetyltransferase [Flavobacterium sp. K5-23]|uniref:GNAT family N-acetyltransferase n=1 Tax=Flavobacterium sp. K5-23 TaxID=2746225 RepID=UPI00200F7DBC|nr:GNAT family N-acetyltransferase [Flavobacterium sp. K5-23]UQD57613.1 GNAT family N-acetyltransferase [Flavobacterium sp. K5-23]